jgi:mono/diheme cytochrome c family protein
MKWIGIVGAIFLLGVSPVARSQESTEGAPQKKVIKKVSMKSTGYSGAEMYREYCAVCHGKEGKGDGPAASELKTAPPDLTVLTARNSGKYPATHVYSVLRFGTPEPAHGTREMPIWGPLFGATDIPQNDTPAIRRRLDNLTKYIETLQSK